MSIFTVTIGAASYETYTDVATATTYISAMFGAAPAKWLALTNDQKGQTLVGATRYLDLQPWDGTATGLAGGTATTLQWPRSGVTIGGIAVDSTVAPAEIPRAAAELAVLIAGDPAVTNKVDQGSNIQSVGGSGVPSVTFFAPTSAASGTATVMPVVVQRLVGKYLAAPSSDAEGGFGQSGSGCSAFSRHRQFTLVWPEE